jgi:hypothetical protein
VIVINQGATFDVVLYKDLLELLYVAPIPYVLICHFNEDLPVITNHYRRDNASKIFSRAFRVLFVTNRNRIEAERQLAKKIPNSDLILNPVNLSDRSYVPWPESRRARFASVARRGRSAIVSDVGGNHEWITEIQTGFVAEAPVTRLVREALDRAWSARSNWSAMGRNAHKFATAKLCDESIPGLLDVISEASTLKRPAGEVLGHLEQEQYRRLVDPPLVQRITQAAETRARKILKGLKVARTALQERRLQRFGRVRADDPSPCQERNGAKQVIK